MPGCCCCCGFASRFIGLRPRLSASSASSACRARARRLFGRCRRRQAIALVWEAASPIPLGRGLPGCARHGRRHALEIVSESSQVLRWCRCAPYCRAVLCLPCGPISRVRQSDGSLSLHFISSCSILSGLNLGRGSHATGKRCHCEVSAAFSLPAAPPLPRARLLHMAYAMALSPAADARCGSASAHVAAAGRLDMCPQRLSGPWWRRRTNARRASRWPPGCQPKRGSGLAGASTRASARQRPRRRRGRRLKLQQPAAKSGLLQWHLLWMRLGIPAEARRKVSRGRLCCI